MDTFYVIKLIARGGNRGYIGVFPDGIKICIGGYDSNVKQFSTFEEARAFIKVNRLEKKGVKAYIRSNQDLIDEKESGIRPIRPEEGEMYYVENEHGAKIHFDPAKNEYFFGMQGVGFCCYREQDLIGLRKMLDGINKDMGMKAEIKKMSELPKK